MAPKRKCYYKRQTSHKKAVANVEEENDAASTSQANTNRTAAVRQNKDEEATPSCSSVSENFSDDWFESLAKSLHEAPPDWQQSTRSVRDRDLYMLENQVWTDCVFTVGPNKQEFKCHRLLLARTSPVFAAMLFGPKFKFGKVINLPDDSPKVFTILLQYIYEGVVNLDDYKEVCDFLIVAKKYIMPEHLLKNLRGYLWLKMYTDNMWTALQFSSQNQEAELMNTAYQIICRETKRCIKMPDFEEMPEDIVVSVIKRDDINCTEVDIFNACMKWSEAEVKRRSLPPGPASLREVFSPFIPHIRFLKMTPQQFTTVPVNSPILTDSEILSIYTNASVSGSTPLPDIICKKVEERTPVFDGTFFVYRQSHEILSDFFNNTCAFYAKLKPRLNKYKDGLFFNLPTQRKENVAESETYNEDLTIYMKKIDTGKVLGYYNFTAEVPYNSMMEINWKLNCNYKDDMNIIFHIVFHKTGIYQDMSTSWLSALHFPS